MIFKFEMDGPLPLHLQCRAVAVDNTWQVTALELFTDSSYSLPSLVAELQFVRLPLATQAQLLDWIERDYQARRFHINAMRVHDTVMAALLGAS